jgi:hypothetical protein
MKGAWRVPFSGKKMFVNNCKILLSTWWSYPLQICDLLWYYTAYSGNFLPTFRYNLWDTILSGSLGHRFSEARMKTSTVLFWGASSSCVSNKSQCNVRNMSCRHIQLSTRRYANLLNVNLNYMFRPQSLAIIKVYKRQRTGFFFCPVQRSAGNLNTKKSRSSTHDQASGPRSSSLPHLYTVKLCRRNYTYA